MEIICTIITYFSYYLIIKWAFQLFYLAKDYLIVDRSTIKADKFKNEWVLITGMSDGIGKALAHEFAKLGYNILGISRNEYKLLEVSSEIEKQHNVKTKIIVQDFIKLEGKIKSYEDLIKPLLNEYNVKYVINNVGLYTPGNFKDLSLEAVAENIDVNICPSVFISKIFLDWIYSKNKEKKSYNKVAENEKKGIINISSTSTLYYAKTLNIYSSTKIFSDIFSRGIALEEGCIGENNLSCNFRVMTAVPSAVETKMSKKKADSFFVITPEQCASSIVDRYANGKSYTFGHFRHYLRALIYRCLDDRIIFWYFSKNKKNEYY